MKIEEVKIGSVKLNPNNPRLIKDDKYEKLLRSVREFPEMLQLRPIVVNDDMVVLGGNMRLKACKEAGLKTVPIIRASELTEDQQREFIVKDNVGYGEWDWEMLANGWDADKLEEWGLDISDFNHKNESEHDDLSDKIKSEFRIEVICANEKEQEITYNKLIEQGFECRLLTL
jgi:ParB-like chromosome segregation protein Spo0J